MNIDEFNEFLTVVEEQSRCLLQMSSCLNLKHLLI